jgi:peptide/nickel transport system ATP-binding protein
MDNTSDSPVLLQVNHLKKYFPIQKGLLKRVVGHVRSVDDLSFFIREGETLGLVGESGCGKTTTGRVILRAIEPTAGQVLYRKDKDKDLIDLTRVPLHSLKPFRRDMQVIFQDPYSSLNPRMTVMEIVGEPLRIHGLMDGDELRTRVRELLEQVGLRVQHMNRYPYAFSGGQRQRIGIARALALQPRFIVCDEPVSALDVSIQAQVLNLLSDLQKVMGLTYLFISHDLSVVEHISDRIAVMYLGSLVELAPAHELFANPKHPYAEALLSAVPSADPDHMVNRILLLGDVPSPSNPPSGCKFHPRCRYAKDICAREIPEWREIEPDHWAACHLADEIKLSGIAYD